jgi:pimeloyl-ACP methyl ester carboxylesterase
MPAFYLTYGQSRFHGISEGSGQQLLICLHGFGESALHFKCLAPALGDIYTIIALDMPLHGKTEWNEGRDFSKDDLPALITQLLQLHDRQQFSLMGYSMGGRLALCVIEKMGAQVKELILLAPDGLKNNPWHLFVTQTSWGNKIFKYNTYHPNLFFRLLILWRKLGLLNLSVYKFAFHSMDTLEKRRRVYEVWTCMRHMMPDKQRCKQLLAQHRIKTLLIFGKYDRVIPPVLASRFVNDQLLSKVIVLEKGHQLLSEQLGYIIKSNL